ncbi:MAG: hypothetical protein QGH97_15230 [Dehalococcoidia bacterium]|nr:hypothetical protein [Dehalococcoidia bacterium]MDP7085689.1 hypothetical protein [Dehalococcoidia bacterium]MDP7200592.1 hypothetical protein [Dehalococcoidia bacterium]MDP7509933.1 hypothetical protein [Dehalococcoidia bacterium]HJN86354.1 hypothetical protein [Dehalococcoidia bacterium]
MPEPAKVFLLAYRSLPEKDQQDVAALLFDEPAARRVFVHKFSEILMDGSEDATLPPSYPATPIRSNRRIVYDTPGELSGSIRGHQVSVSQFPGRNFRTMIDGTDYRRLPMDLVEGQLGLQVNRKSDGGNSETHARAIYRHFVDRYNGGDQTVVMSP